MNKSSKSSKKDNEKTEREALDDLQRMVDYCMIPGCRRKCLLQHFGERNVDPRTMCFDKCDFCLDPKAVEKAIDSATASNDFTYHVQSKAKPSWDGQWDHPAGENDQATKDTDWNVDGLDITGVRTFDGEADGATSRGKPSAEAVLSKFEVKIGLAADTVLRSRLLTENASACAHTSILLFFSNKGTRRQRLCPIY